MGYRMQLHGVSECGSSTRCWIGLQVRRIGCSICGALALVALAPPLPVSAVSDNDVVVESEFESEVESESEVIVPTEEEVESSDISESESEMDNDNFGSVSDNSVASGSAAESESFDSDFSVSENDVNNYYPDFYSDYNVYNGAISSTYLEYMRGYLPKLDWDEHYVAARVSRYDYIFAYSADLTYNGVFTGSDVVVVKFNTSQDYAAFSVTVEPSFSLSVGSNLVYTDLSHQFPMLASSSDFSLRQIVVFLAISITVWTVGTFLRRTPVASRRRRRWYP